MLVACASSRISPYGRNDNVQLAEYSNKLSASASGKLTGRSKWLRANSAVLFAMAGIQRDLKALQNNTLFFRFYLAVGLSKTTRKPTNSKALWGKPLSRLAERKDAALLV